MELFHPHVLMQLQLCEVAPQVAALQAGIQHCRLLGAFDDRQDLQSQLQREGIEGNV